MIVKSRTLAAVNVCVSPLAETRDPEVAIVIARSVVILTRTLGLTGVMNGSPWFGRLKGMRRLTYGSQR